MGAYDQDDPFRLFASVRELGAVHSVTLADGHGAWLVCGHEQARVALKDPRLSKDMHAAMAADSGVVSEGLPGPAFARHMLSVDPPDHTRLRRLVAAAFPSAGSRGCGPGCRPSWTTSSTHRRPRTRQPVDLIAAFAFPLPFTVICELLGVQGRSGHRWAGAWPRCLFPSRRPLTTRRPKRRPTRSWQC